jgi:hypothetical protein
MVTKPIGADNITGVLPAVVESRIIALAAPSGVDAEGVRDVIGAALVAGANITITVNDAGDTITIASTTDQEVIRDTMGTALVAGTNVTITPNDAANTITIASTSTSGLDAEGVRDTMAAALVAGANITIAANDAGDTITIDTATTVQVVVRWNDVTDSWPARPVSAPFGVLFLSTNDPTATQPPTTNLLVGDRWIRHPDAP